MEGREYEELRQRHCAWPGVVIQGFKDATENGPGCPGDQDCVCVLCTPSAVSLASVATVASPATYNDICKRRGFNGSIGFKWTHNMTKAHVCYCITVTDR